MKFVSPSADVSLAAVRYLSEHAVNRPWDRTLRCLKWPRPVHQRAAVVFHPWKMHWRDSFKDVMPVDENRYADKTWINPRIPM